MKLNSMTQIALGVMVVMFAAGAACAQSGGQGAPPLSAQALDDLVAPVALYPDPLLSQLLPASAYPLEVVQAARWLDQNKALQKSAPDQFKAALDGQDWDASVKALLSFPTVLGMLNDKLDWTSRLGDAFVNQQKDVMDAVQRMRAKAQAAGSLKTTPQQKVIVQDQIIEVEPANPQVVYVPAYNPQVVYVSAPPAYSGGDLLAASAVSFGLGVAVGSAWWGGCNWGGGYVENNYNFYNNHWNNNRWNNNHWINPNRYGPHNLYQPQKSQPWQPDQNRRQADRGGSAAGDGGGGARRVPDSSQVASELGDRGWSRGAAADGGSFSKSGSGFDERDLARADRGGERGGAFDGLDRGSRDLDYGARGRSSGGWGGGEDFHPAHSSFDGLRGFGGGFHGGGGFHMGRR